jgi:hypothetical protein
MKFRNTTRRAVATIAAATLAGATHASTLSHFATRVNTDFAMFGYGGMAATGIASDGTGTITVAGVSGTVRRATLVWHGPTSSANDAVNATVTFNGTSVTGVHVGTSDSNCWSGFTNSRAYQADVTSLVAGNGAYTLSNFVKGAYPAPAADVNGASLLVFFDDGNAANDRDIVIALGNDSNRPNAYDADGWGAAMGGVDFTAGTVTLRLVVSDGQDLVDPRNVLVNAAVVFPGGQVFDGNTVPNGPAAANPNINGGLWDQKSSNITALLAPGPNMLTLTAAAIDPAAVPAQDCLSLIATVLDLPAGSAIIPVPAIPTLSDWALGLLALLTGGVAGLQLRRRRAQ